MKSRKERLQEKVVQVERLVGEYTLLIQEIQQGFATMILQRDIDGNFPDGAKARIDKLHGKAQRLGIRVLRHRADMIELGLPTAFDDVPTAGPDALPEGW